MCVYDLISTLEPGLQVPWYQKNQKNNIRFQLREKAYMIHIRCKSHLTDAPVHRKVKIALYAKKSVGKRKLRIFENLDVPVLSVMCVSKLLLLPVR